MTSAIQWLSLAWAFITSGQGTVVLLVVGFAFLIYVVVKPEKPRVAPSKDQLVAEMKAQLTKDSDKFDRCLFIHNIEAHWSSLLETDPYFTIDVHVFSSSVLRLNIGEKYDGHLYYGVEPIGDRGIEVMKPIKDLARSSTDFIRLRQWVSPPRMSQIKSDRGKKIPLLFSHINIRVEGRLPGNATSLISRLPLPNQWDVTIPTMDELNSHK